MNLAENNVLQLKAEDFEENFSDVLGMQVRKYIAECDFKYRDITFEEYNEGLKAIVEKLLSDNLEYAGEHRRLQWEQGWDENLVLLKKSSQIDAIKPKYFDKYNIVRWKQKFIKPLSPDFEPNMLATIEAWLFDKYMMGAKVIYEFGCGTGHNLLRLRKFNSDAVLWGLDWVESSQALIAEIARKTNDKKLFGHKFDYFCPDYSFDLDSESVVFTVASLEQVGNKYVEFVDYLLQKKPKICIHIEPIGELLDENNLLDYLSIQYFLKRKYLKGYLSYLKKLEQNGDIEILRTQRTYIGSLYIDGYSVIVWRPL